MLFQIEQTAIMILYVTINLYVNIKLLLFYKMKEKIFELL
jgi:hypothetical protein